MGEALLDLILFLVVSRAFWKLVGGMMSGMSTPRAPQTPERGVQMVRDPVCGTFVVPNSSVMLVDGRQHVYFCSTACRDRYGAGSSTRSATSRTA